MSNDIESFEKALQSACSAYLDPKRSPPNLTEAIRYSLLAPGKRIRPRLVLATGRLHGLSSDATMPAAIAIEMVHCFTLIHDDLPCMDDDDFRRGRPSNHKVHGEGMALLAGDALLALAFEALSECAPFIKPSAFLEALHEFAKASGPAGVIGGQAAENLLKASSSLDELLEMHAKKTGALFEASILVPMHMACIRPDSNEGEAHRHFASALGMAFQIADDLEDALEAKEKAETNILSQLSKDDAKARALKALRSAIDGITTLYPSSSESLCSIAQGLDRRLSSL